MEGCDRDNWRCSKQLQIAEAVRAIAAREAEEGKHEMEVEIEKVVKAQKEAQSALVVADTKEQIAHNKESRAQVVAEENARRIAGAGGHQHRTPKRSSSLSESILNRSQRGDRLAMYPRKKANLAKQSGVSKNTQHNVKQLLWENNTNL